MTPTKFRAALKLHGLSQDRIAAFFGVYPRVVRRWADGKQDIPQAVAAALNTRPQVIVDQTSRQAKTKALAAR